MAPRSNIDSMRLRQTERSRYLYPPIDRGDDGPAWTFDAWGWMLREGLGLSPSSSGGDRS
ncbi:MAG: hypothetical protein ACRD3G_28120 [Vicinamibacterales bacterium]